MGTMSEPDMLCCAVLCLMMLEEGISTLDIIALIVHQSGDDRNQKGVWTLYEHESLFQCD